MVQADRHFAAHVLDQLWIKTKRFSLRIDHISMAITYNAKIDIIILYILFTACKHYSQIYTMLGQPKESEIYFKLLCKTFLTNTNFIYTT